MAGTKRSLPSAAFNGNKRAKTVPSKNSKASKFASKQKTKPVQPPSPESTDFSDDGDSLDDDDEVEAFDSSDEGEVQPASKKVKIGSSSTQEGDDDDLTKTKHSEMVNGEGYLKTTGSTSREAHAKQKVLAQERKASKPNADLIARSKKIWERLRRKSHVPRDERKTLVLELFEIITGRVHDFVFKHDSVRVIQTALKYGNLEQRKVIARELKGAYKTLAESRYAKFLIGKLMVHGDQEIRDIIIPEFYGNVKRLIRHPEASWIVDDIYRTVATKQQKAILLREWYGPEFVIFQKGEDKNSTAELSDILKTNPEKRGPIMKHLHELTNQLVQKKTTGFTMLHDAMLQYFLNLKPGSAEFNESIQMLLDDEEGDCLKNLAFTKSGSRLVCLTLAHASAKDRKLILRHYKGTMKLLASDQYGHLVLLTAFDVIDDTVMTSKSIVPELLLKDNENQNDRIRDLLTLVTDLTSRIPVLNLFNPASSQPKWLLQPHPHDAPLLSEIHSIRTTTSKKEPETRRVELLKSLSQTLLDLIASHAAELAQSTPGTQFISEVLLGTVSPSLSVNNTPALQAILSLVNTDTPTTTTSSSSSDPDSSLLASPSFARLLKTLSQSGKFSPETKTIVPTNPPLGFAELLFDSLVAQDGKVIAEWATSTTNPSLSFVVVGMLEMGDRFERQQALRKILKGKANAKKIKAAAEQEGQGGEGKGKGHAGAKILVQLLGL